MPTSQTLSRGIQVLEILAASPNALSIAEIAAKLEVHRSIAYRIIRTLENHRLLSRDHAGHIRTATGLSSLAASVQQELQAAAQPQLAKLSHSLSLTVFLSVWEHDVCTAVLCSEPQGSPNAVPYRTGSTHSMSLGADSAAIQSSFTKEQFNAMAPELEYRPLAREARINGYAQTQNELVDGAACLAAPIHSENSAPAALAVLMPENAQVDKDLVVRALKEAALSISEALAG